MMKRIKHKIAALLAIAATLITAGCKAPALLPTEKMQLPETYIYEDTDTTTISKIPWKSFFPDTLLITYIETALANNHSFLKTIEQISIARSQLKVAKGALLPRGRTWCKRRNTAFRRIYNGWCGKQYHKHTRLGKRQTYS